jgi:ribosomal protection tetracycline resistance protein
MSIRNIGIFAHVDAGKTTLTEQLLLLAGSIRQAGSVDKGTAHTDDLPVERRRGISVRASCVALTWKGVRIHLIDTPGHTDFSAEIERSLWALDAAVLAVDACRGVQPQTETLFAAFRNQGLPCLVFINKSDRPEADPEKVLRQLKRRLKAPFVSLWDDEALTEYVCGADDGMLEKYVSGLGPDREEVLESFSALSCSGQAHAVLYGSALKGTGVEALLDAMVRFLPAPAAVSGHLCAVAFAACQDRLMGRGLWVRVFGGRLENRMPLDVLRGTDPVTGEKVWAQHKISQIRDASGQDTGVLNAGEVGTVYGLGDLTIGYVFGDEALLPRQIRPGTLKAPLITVQVLPQRKEDMQALREACRTLSLEDPLLQARYEKATGELRMQVMGKIQLEILKETLETRFGLGAVFGEPRVIYKETIASRATGFVAYTMPKPCWAVLQFDICPAPRGSGVSYTSMVPARDILPRYQHQVEQALPKALSQGRLGWEVTDVSVTLVGGNHHLIHTHPLDFIVATPMGIQDGLKRGGSVLLEPILEMRFVMPPECIGRVMSDVQLMRGEVTQTESDEDAVTLTALVPVASSMDYPETFASLTGGRGSMSASLHSYRDCPLALGAECPRRGVDPLDSAKYILAARSALEGDIYD